MAAGASRLRPRRLQDDLLFDTLDGSLRRDGCVLRVRREPGSAVLTLKGPPQPGLVKTREEHETTVADGAVLITVLEALGLRPIFRYQKFREEFTAEGVIIAVDETPIGTFIEIEGREDAIVATAARLGSSPAGFILASYRTLFAAHCEQFELTGTDMVFAADGAAAPGGPAGR
jgi:adenylate cyclase class 2